MLIRLVVLIDTLVLNRLMSTVFSEMLLLWGDTNLHGSTIGVSTTRKQNKQTKKSHCIARHADIFLFIWTIKTCKLSTLNAYMTAKIELVSIWEYTSMALKLTDMY